MVLCDNLKLINQNLPQTSSLSVSWRNPSSFFVHPGCRRKRFSGFVANAANNNNKYSRKRKRKRSWWQRFFFDDDGNWLGLKDDDMEEKGEDMLSQPEEVSEGDKFEAWKRRAEAIIELRDAQEDMRNEESRRWEDWIVVGDDNKHGAAKDWDDESVGVAVGEEKENGLVQSVRDLVLGREDEEILYEDRVFRYASLNSVRHYF